MKSKLIKTLLPTIVGMTAVVPAMTTITSCHDKEENITVDNKSITSTNSYSNYKFKMKNKPDNGIVHATIKDQNENLVRFYTEDTTNSSATEADITVNEDGSFELPVGLVLAGTSSSDSKFNIEFTYTKDGTATTQTIDDCGFGYNLEYYDLKKGEYTPKLPALNPGWSTGKIGEHYEAAVLENQDIYVDDARYTTAQNIAAAITANKLQNINSFKANFNDVYREKDGGLHLHMSYDVNGAANSSFTVNTASSTWLFENFQVQFSLETMSGYNFGYSSHSGTDPFVLTITDTAGTYNLTGKIKGSFTWRYNSAEKHVVNFTTDQILNDTSSSDELTDMDAALLLSSGIMCLTYGFEFGTAIPALKLQSPYCKNSTLTE